LLKEIELSEKVSLKENTLLNGKDAEISKMPEMRVEGNKEIEIISSSFYGEDGVKKGVIAKVRNVSTANIGKAVFRVVFYDVEGNVLDDVEADIKNLKPDEIYTLKIMAAKERGIECCNIKITKVIITPLPVATGNDKIKVMKHSLYTIDASQRSVLPTKIDLAIRNVSDITVATAIFEAVFYDAEGNVLDTLRHREHELKPNCSRAISISTDKDANKVAKSYKVTLIKTRTVDVEKVLLHKHEVRITPTGDEEVRGVLNNISGAKTDVALVATFMDYEDEKIITRVISVKDIEPKRSRKFHFICKIPEGEKVRTYTLTIGEMLEPLRELN
jgi:hypothetical protein